MGSSGTDSRVVLKAHVAMLTAQAIFGGWNVVAKYALADGISPILFTLVRSILTVLVLAVMLRALRTRSCFDVPSKDDRYTFVQLGVLTFGVQICYVMGVYLTSASLAGVFQCLGPIAGLVLAVCLKLESFMWRTGLAGIVTLVLEDTSQGSALERGKALFILGCALLVLEAIFIAYGTIVQKKVLHKYTPATVILYQTVTSTIIFALALLVDWAAQLEKELLHIPNSALWGWAYAVLLSTCVGYSFKALANTYLTASLVMLYQAVQPLVTLLLAALLLAEHITPLKALGSVLIIAAMLMGTLRGAGVDHSTSATLARANSEVEAEEDGLESQTPLLRSSSRPSSPSKPGASGTNSSP